MTTVLVTSGNEFRFASYCPNDDVSAAEKALAKRRVVQVAMLVHAMDARPRQTIIFHETA